MENTLIASRSIAGHVVAICDAGQSRTCRHAQPDIARWSPWQARSVSQSSHSGLDVAAAVPSRAAWADVTTVVLMTATWLLFWRLGGSGPPIARRIGPPMVTLEIARKRARCVAGRVVFALASVSRRRGVVLGQRTERHESTRASCPNSRPRSSCRPRVCRRSSSRTPAFPPLTRRSGATRGRKPRLSARGSQARPMAEKAMFTRRAAGSWVEPGSVDLDLLHRRLMELKFTWRGHEQVLPLALAYDWLHDRFLSIAASRASRQNG